MHWPWEELGIAPTNDAVAIKRAYAKRLKTTRPDDDATAYQQLREAYDAALDWARSQQAVPAPEMDEPMVPAASQSDVAEQSLGGLVSAHPSGEDGNHGGTLSSVPDAAAVEPPVDDGASWPAADDGFSASPEAPPPLPEAMPSEESGEPPPEFATPEAITRGVYAYWREHGDDALAALWPRVRYDLDALPLVLRADASNWMATLVLDCPELPAGFVLPVAAYFDWREDFRAAAALGTERAHALHERLHELGLRGKSDEMRLRRFRDARVLAQLLRQGTVWRARLLTMLIPGAAAERLGPTPDDLREASGMSHDEAVEINQLALWHWGGGAAGLFVLFMMLFVAMGGSPGRAYLDGGLAVGMALLALMGGFLFSRLLDWLSELTPDEDVTQWAACHPRLVTLVMLGASSGMAAWAYFMPADVAGLGGSEFLGGWGLALLLPLIVWPRGRRWRALVLPLSIALTLMLRGLWPEHSALFSFVLAQAWVLTANMVLEHRTGEVVAFYRNPFAYLKPRDAWHWVLFVAFIKGVVLLAVALFVITLPLTVLVSTLRHGVVAGVATLACAGVIAKGITQGDDLPLALFIGLLAAIWLMAALRWLSGKFAERLRP